MSELKVTGEVKQILKPESGKSKAGKEWNKQDFVIETDDQYPKMVCFTLFGDKTDLLSQIETSNKVDVYFNLESREYNGKYFHNVNAWRIQKLESEQNEPTNDGNQLPPEFNEDEVPF